MVFPEIFEWIDISFEHDKSEQQKATIRQNKIDAANKPNRRTR